jgi:hypothetical protein
MSYDNYEFDDPSLTSEEIDKLIGVNELPPIPDKVNDTPTELEGASKVTIEHTKVPHELFETELIDDTTISIAEWAFLKGDEKTVRPGFVPLKDEKENDEYYTKNN